MGKDIRSAVKNAGDHMCKWHQSASEEDKHWDNVGYKQGIYDCLQILKMQHAIKDFDLTKGVTLNE